MKNIATLITMVALAGFAGRAPAIERCITSESKGEMSTSFYCQVTGGEQILVGYLGKDDDHVVPLNGRRIPALADGVDFILQIANEFDSESGKKRWRIGWGVKKGGDGYILYNVREGIDGEQDLPVHCIRAPVSTDGLRLYLVPFRVVDDQVHCAVVAIAPNRETLRKNLAVKPMDYFSWDDFEVLNW